MTVKDLVIIALSSLCLTACQKGVMYSDFQSVSMANWSMDSTLRFVMPVTDTINPYNVILHVRHTDAYPYQNMWLFVSDGLRTDTIEFYLANDRGEWLGNGSSIHDMPILYREHIRLIDKNIHTTEGIYTLTIQQGMRDIILRGISEIGVEIVQ